ncbi:MAG TPA: uracil-DNA glycosylase [Sphingobacteriaceae bacterium]|nr:uracil-DNA glycosylase [Sphingobacteriaceae bacterium]
MRQLIDNDWDKVLHEEFDKPYVKTLNDFLLNERKHHQVFPPENNLFDALKKTPFEKIKVIILGQDPYHQVGQANGLAFSVGAGTRIPPSLRNMYKELSSDVKGFEIPLHGDLSSWAEQGVLLLNTTLSVRENNAGSHQKKGWEELTDEIIRKISDLKTGVVFLLWGKFAQQKISLIDIKKHHILCTSHPSPLSAHRGFLGSKTFSKTNELLMQDGKEPIIWQL